MYIGQEIRHIYKKDGTLHQICSTLNENSVNVGVIIMINARVIFWCVQQLSSLLYNTKILNNNITATSMYVMMTRLPNMVKFILISSIKTYMGHTLLLVEGCLNT